MNFFLEIKTFTLKLSTYILIKSGIKIIQTTSKAEVKIPINNI